MANYQYPMVDDTPILTRSVVAFLDSLGTKAIALDPARAQSHLERLWDAIHDPIVDNVLNDQADAYAIATFTDNVVIGVAEFADGSDLENEYGLLLILTAAYQLALVNHGVFIRGGIALGELWMNESFVFGSALIQAYEVETRMAVYPRVVVKGDLARLAKGHAEFYYGSPAESPQNAHLVRAADGEVFVNYLVATEDFEPDEAIAQLANHRSCVIEGLSDSHGAPGVVEKYLWAAEYHNWYCGLEHPDHPELHIDPQPNESKFFRLIDPLEGDDTIT